MPRLIKSVPGFFTAAGAGVNALTVSPGSSGTFTIDSYTNGSAYLEQVWASGAAFDFIRIRSGRLHDAAQGMRLYTGTTLRRRLIGGGMSTRLYSVDNLTVESDATGAGTSMAVLTYGFDDFVGSSQRLANWSEIQPRIQDISGVEVDVTSSATIGTYGASANLNSFADNYKAGQDYALLGYTVNAAVAAIAINGPETSGQDICFPGDPDAFATRDYFIEQNLESGRPFIPIINANNKGSTFLKSVDTAASTAVKVSLILARLG